LVDDREAVEFEKQSFLGIIIPVLIELGDSFLLSVDDSLGEVDICLE